MNTAIMISDSTIATASFESGNRGKAAPEQIEDGAEQRFADVLPLAEVALESPSEKNASEETATEDRSVDVEAGADSPAGKDHPASEESTTLLGNPQIAGWPFAAIVQPAVGRAGRTGSGLPRHAGPTAKGQGTEPASEGRTTEPAASDLIAGKQASKLLSRSGQVSDAGSVPVGTKRAQQPSAKERPGGTSAGAAVVAHDAASGKQGNALPVAGAGGQTMPTPQRSQDVTGAAAVQITQPAPTGARSERTRDSANSQVAKEASESGKQETPATFRQVHGAQAGVVEKTEHAPAKAPTTNPPAAAGAETSSKAGNGSQGPAREAHETAPSQQSTASGERLKAEQTASAGKDIPAAGPTDGGVATSNSSVSTIGGSVALPQRPAAPMQIQSQAGGEPFVTRAPTQSIGEQILDSVQASAARGDRQVLVRLNPPELGTVLVRFQEHGELLSGTLEVSSREARREIEQALPQVVRSLQEAGVQVRRLDVVPSDQPDRDLSREHLPQDAWAQHQEAGQNREHSYASSQTRWSQGTGSHGTVRETASGDEPQAAAAQGSIDLLL